ncbi:MAG: transposase, partial [Bacteroidota bacterium]
MNRDEPIEGNLFYHIYNRGNDRQRIFGDESDYFAFLKKMKSLAVQYSVAVPIYALMPNHYHLIALQNTSGNLSNMMGALATSAAKRYNLKFGHIGHLFQGPFRYKVVSEEFLWYVACYIHLNPVRAGLAKLPGEWPYSNFEDLCKRLKETCNSVWQGYPNYVYNVLKDDVLEKEFRAKVKGY